jgi:hypothetical protein
MSSIAYLIWIPSIACVVLLYLGVFTKHKRYQLAGNILIVVCCGTDSFVFFYTHHIWMGMGFAFPAITQMYALIASRLKSHHN